MRLLHTSDWHLGRTLHEVDLIDAQRDVLGSIADIARERHVDAIIVAGDVYDRSVPSIEAINLLEDALIMLTEIAPVFMLAGNHDSATRLGFGRQLFGERLWIASTFDDALTPRLLHDEHGPVAFYAVPYIEPDRYRSHLRNNEVADDAMPGRTHDACGRHLMDSVRAKHAELESEGRVRCVVAAHAFVIKAAEERDSVEVSESERDIRVGGLDYVTSQAFSGIDYVALGHLHGPQEPGAPAGGDRPTRLRYSGSPLRYSFSEQTHTKSVTVVELDANGVSDIDVVSIDQPRGMVTLTDTMESLLTNAAYRDHEDSWVRIYVTDPVRPADMYARLRARFPHLLVHRHQSSAAPIRGAGAEIVRTAQDPLEVVDAFVAHVIERNLQDDERVMVVDAYEASMRAKADSA